MKLLMSSIFLILFSINCFAGEYFIDPSFSYYSEKSSSEDKHFNVDNSFLLLGIHTGFRFNWSFLRYSVGMVYEQTTGNLMPWPDVPGGELSRTNLGLAGTIYYSKYACEFVYYLSSEYRVKNIDRTDGRGSYKMSFNYYSPITHNFSLVPKFVLLKHMQYNLLNGGPKPFQEDITNMFELGFDYVF